VSRYDFSVCAVNDQKTVVQQSAAPCDYDYYHYCYYYQICNILES